MRIEVVISAYFPRWGGTENQARKQVAELVRRGHQVGVITWQYDPAHPAVEYLDGAIVRRVPRAYGPVGGILSAARMATALTAAALRADVIAAHQLLLPTYLAAAVGALTRTPVMAKAAITVALPNTDVRLLTANNVHGIMRRLVSLPLRLSGVGVAISEEIERDLRGLGFRQVVRIPNGVVDAGMPDRAALRQQCYTPVGIDPGSVVVATAGRILWWKGFDVLVEAWAKMRPHRNWRLIIVGAGPAEPELRAQIAELGVESSVHVITASTRAGDYLAAADVAVVPSLYDGMSNVLLEALAAGTPCVATSISGAVDVIEDGQTGRLVPPGDSDALAEALRAVILQPGELGQRGRERVLSLCEISSVVDRYESLFEALHKGKSAGPSPNGAEVAASPSLPPR